MTMTGDMINADQALQLGLVNQVVPLSELMPTVMKKVETILTRSPLAVSEAKKSINQAFDLETEPALENEALIFANLFTSQDTREGTKAFIEKRKPVFKGE
jgi:enoyl-CoA hydratase